MFKLIIQFFLEMALRHGVIGSRRFESKYCDSPTTYLPFKTMVVNSFEIPGSGCSKTQRRISERIIIIIIIIIKWCKSDNFLELSTLFLKHWVQEYDKTDDSETLEKELANVIMNHHGVTLDELSKITQNLSSL
jgi:hypothetical protein